jgi:hypothetical protein
MTKSNMLGRLALCALATNIFIEVGLAGAKAAPISAEQLQAQLNSLQKQINELKVQRKALTEQAKQQEEVARQQGVIIRQQQTVQQQQAVIDRRIDQIDKPNINGPNLNNPSMTFSKASLPNVMILPDNTTVSLHGEFAAFAALENSSANNVNGFKLNPIAGDAYAVLVPAVNFQATDTLNYGAKSVVWIAETAAGVGSNQNATLATGVPSLLVHYGYGYIQSDIYGTLNFGQVAGTWLSMEVGNPNLDSGGWDRLFQGGLANVIPANVRPFYFRGTITTLDSTLKLVYMTPPIYNFSIGASFEPSSNGIKQGSFTCAEAATTCAALASSPSSADIGKRRKNTVDAAIKFHEEMGDYTFLASAGFLYGSTISYDGPPTTAAVNFLPLKMGRFGAEIRGPLGPGKFIISGNTEFGNAVDTFAFQPVGASNAFEYIIGATYLVDRWKFAAAYFSNETSGFYGPGVTGRHEFEIGAEGEVAYSLTDHWKVMLNYLYGSREQGGFNFITQAPGNAFNHVNGQTIALGTQFEW